MTEPNDTTEENAEPPEASGPDVPPGVPPGVARPIEPAPGGTAAPRPGAKERTVQVSLRLPANWVAMLRQRAFAAAAAEDAMITPQEIVRRMIAHSLDQK